MHIQDDPQRSGNSACFYGPTERSWTWESPALGRRSSHDGSTRDADREFTQAQGKSTPGTLSGAVWRGIAVFESRAPLSTDCLALAGEGGRRSERAGPEASGGTGRRCRSAGAGATPLLACGRIRRTRTVPGARSPSATCGYGAEKGVWGAHHRSGRAGNGLRVSGEAVPVVESDCAARHGNTLERVSLLRPPEGTLQMSASSPVVRCAIYTRKSTEEGLEQAFNTLQAQRESAEAYILSHKQEGWHAVPTIYNDGGFSGASLERPALQRLLADIEAHRIDCVVVYKVDRLSRSLLDFTRLLSLFDKRGVSFVSVTQDFNTSTSMGRLTLNILLSFAQFEREIIGERTRDKLSAARRKGKWIGGTPVLGYDVAPEGGRLVVNPAEAEQVREIFSLCAGCSNTTEARRKLHAGGYTSKQWTSQRGKRHGGQPLSMSTLRLLLTNVLYRGDISHKDTLHPGEQEPIVSRELWLKVNTRLKLNRVKTRSNARFQTLLENLVTCGECGSLLKAGFTRRQGLRHVYYVCRAGKKREPACPQQPVAAFDLDRSLRERFEHMGRTCADSLQVHQLIRTL